MAPTAAKKLYTEFVDIVKSGYKSHKVFGRLLGFVID